MPACEEPDNYYANNLKRLIRLSGYKVVEVANELQIPRSTLYGYISGKRPIPKRYLKDIVNLLRCDAGEFHYECVTDPLAQAGPVALLALSGPATTIAEVPVQPGAKHSSEDSVQPESEPLYAPPEVKLPVTEADYPIWFGKRLAYIVTAIAYGTWREQSSYHELQAWVDKEIHMFDEIKPLWTSDGYSISRRQAIIAIAALPTVLLTAVQNDHRSALVKQEFLFRCSASITACWHLMAGRDFAEVKEAVTPYLPVLMRWSQDPSEFQQQSADLAAQGQILLGLVSLHTVRPPYSIQGYMTHAKQAAEYGQISKNASLHVATLIAHLRAAFRYSERPDKMLQVCQQAMQYSNEVSPLEQSITYSALAEAYGYNGKLQETLRYIELAHEIRPATIDYLPPFLSADNGLFGMFYEGRAYLALGAHYPEGNHLEQAWNTLVQVERLPSTVVFPERIRIEIVNQQTLAAVKMGDLDRFCTYFEKGVNGAKMLGSEKRRQEAAGIYWQARDIWPHETRVKELAELFVSMN